jgi:hypothetical protein
VKDRPCFFMLPDRQTRLNGGESGESLVTAGREMDALSIMPKYPTHDGENPYKNNFVQVLGGLCISVQFS